MTISVRFLLKGTVWTIGAFGIVQVIRLVTNIVLARLVAPELFGLMTIVNSLRIGIELMSDVGVSQNIIYHKNANDPEFYNTAWTIQAIRGVGIWLVGLILAVPVAMFYQFRILIFVMPLIMFTSVLAGFSSISLALLQKRLQIARLYAFDTIIALIGAIAIVVFVYLSPTIWALIFGFLFGCTLSTIGSYYLLPDVKQRPYLSKQYVGEIFHFGKWVFAASMVYFLSSNLDRLYLAKAVSLDLLGVYGIARSIAEAMSTVVLRLSASVLFPFISSYSHVPRSDLHERLVGVRAKYLLLAGCGFSLIVATADLPIKFLYDERYQAAGWMLPILIVGSWFSILACINESVLLGLGKPAYTAISNGTKLLFLLVGLPLSVKFFGLIGGIVVVAVSDLFRYFPLLISQRREHFSFGRQDLLITFGTFLLIGLWEWLRSISGFGNSFESLPIENFTLFGFGW